MSSNSEAGVQLQENSPLSDYEPTLLIVDDESSIRTSLIAVLRFYRPEFHLGEAASAEEALEVLENNEVDLIITDLKLPKMDGLSLVQTALSLYPETRSILMTAYGSNTVDYGAYHTGCVSYLEKPFDVDKLISSVDEVISQFNTNSYKVAEKLAHQVSVAANENLNVSILVSNSTDSGLLVLQDQHITYADFGSQVGIGALIAMLNCEDPKIVVKEEAAELSNADLPINWHSFFEAAYMRTISKQISALRESGRNQIDEPNEEYPPSIHDELLIRKAMFAEQIQRQRETRLDSSLEDELKRKRLHFHQQFAVSMIDRQVELRKLINTGIEHYSKDKFDKARESWIKALALDPNCQQAKFNLAKLEQRDAPSLAK